MSAIREEITARLSCPGDVPACSGAVARLAAALRDPQDADFDEVVDIVEHDIGLAARLLRVVNAAHYAGRYGRIADIRQAVSRIGLTEVSRICLAASAMELFPAPSGLIALGDFWLHSVSVALSAREIATSGTPAGGEGELFVAGLFHDIGALVLDRVFPYYYREARELAQGENLSVYEAERYHLGIEHGEAGALVLDAWGIVPGAVTAVAFHHYPHNATETYAALTRILHLTDFACAALGAFGPGDSQPRECSFSAWDECEIDMQRMQQIITNAQTRIDEAGTFVELMRE